MLYMLCFHVPDTHIEEVKKAIFTAGAGKIGDYDCCSWQVLGQGQFKPLEGSNPYIGDINQIKTVKEYKVETVCDEQYIHEVVHALKKAHPYETPSYQIWPLLNL